MPTLMLQAQAILQRMVWWKFILYSIGSLGMSWLTATNGINNWIELMQIQKINIWVGCIASWAFTMVAFLDRGIKDASQGKIPFSEASNEVVESSQSSSVTKDPEGKIVAEERSKQVTQPQPDEDGKK